MNLGKPTPKAAWAPPPTLIPGRCHVSGPASGSGPLGSRPSPAASGSQATPPPGGARQPETVEEVGAGQCPGAFAFEKQPRVGAAGGGAWTLFQSTPSRRPGRPSARGDPAHRGTMEMGGRRAPPDKGPPSPAPGVSSFLQVVFFGPITPSEARRSVKVWHCGGQGHESWMGAATCPPTSMAWPPPQMPLISLEPPSLWSLSLGQPPVASRPS